MQNYLDTATIESGTGQWHAPNIIQQGALQSVTEADRAISVAIGLLATLFEAAKQETQNIADTAINKAFLIIS
ncbi:MAG: hypothetical protein KAS93_06280 [Gammaproteobacteria bacterium]|nr:hypothetical protein [Gammaproteobacteria bacterium]